MDHVYSDRNTILIASNEPTRHPQLGPWLIRNSGAKFRHGHLHPILFFSLYKKSTYIQQRKDEMELYCTGTFHQRGQQALVSTVARTCPVKANMRVHGSTASAEPPPDFCNRDLRWALRPAGRACVVRRDAAAAAEFVC